MDKQTFLERVPEYKKDFKKYAEEVLYIQTKSAKMSRFKLNRAQNRVWQVVKKKLEADKPVRMYLLKARQLGFSTLIQGLAYWNATLWPNQNELIVSHEILSAETLFGKSKVFYGLSPHEMRPERQLSNRRELKFAKDDKEGTGDVGLQSRILIQTADNVHLGASHTLHFVHLSEFARYEKVQKDVRLSFATLMQAVPKSGRNFAFIETTAFGLNHGYEFWEEDNSWEKIFISWVADATYTAKTPLEFQELEASEATNYGNERTVLGHVEDELREWYPRKAKDSEWVRHEALKRMRWRREIIKEGFVGQDGLKLFKQEYPITAREAFITSGDNVFDTTKIADMKLALEGETTGKIQFPATNMRYDPHQKRFENARYGEMRVYEAPVSGKRYAIGADVAEGIREGDRSAAQVLSLPDLVQVATFQARIDPGDFADTLAALGWMYNGALIAVEINGPGYATNHRLSRTLIYPYMYNRESYDAQSRTFLKRYGWQTNRATKSVLISDMRKALNENLVQYRDVPTLDEMSTYIETDTGKLEAAPGYHDDLVMSLGISLQMVLQAHAGDFKPPEPTQAPEGSFEWYGKIADAENLRADDWRTEFMEQQKYGW
jgi:hypothetical protein